MAIKFTKEVEQERAAAKVALATHADPFMEGILNRIDENKATLVIEKGPVETAAQAMGDAPVEKRKIKIEFYAKTRYLGSKATETVEMDADSTDAEIDAMAQEVCIDLYETGWNKKGFVDEDD